MIFPKCPHCNYEFNDENIWHTGSTDFPKGNDGDVTDTACLNCKKPLKIALNLEPSWTFLDEDDNEIEIEIERGEV